jgi:UDP-N-acetylglucosamine 2-epimerase (non-hydrolysing)
MRTLSVVGTRPNFVKMAPVVARLRTVDPEGHHALVHTGQHYDTIMSDVFFEELGVPRPAHLLDVGSGSHAAQTARVMERIDPVIQAEQPDVMLVPGDVNSTLGAALVAAKVGVPIAHVESGLRSFDRTMPEEINRVLVDDLSQFLFVHSPEAVENLRREGVDDARIHLVGNTMIDSLAAMMPTLRPRRVLSEIGVERGSYLLVTLHRPGLVDGPILLDVIERLNALASEMPVVFPMHPRTLGRVESLGVRLAFDMLDPFGYYDFLALEANAAAVLTDSGGVQEETTYLGVPCFTLRDNTERPVTVRAGTNTVLGLDPARIADIPAALSARRPIPRTLPEGWDGRASERLVDVLARAFGPALAPVLDLPVASAEEQLA